MTKLYELKILLKNLSSEIRTIKTRLSKPHDANCALLQAKLHWMKSDCRHKHIAYCLLRGRPYEVIEKPRQGNEPNQILIKEIMDAYTENVRACA